jgi:hypothetical protein
MIVNDSGCYVVRFGDNAAALRIAASNLFDVQGIDHRGAGACDITGMRLVSAYLTLNTGPGDRSEQ